MKKPRSLTIGSTWATTLEAEEDCMGRIVVITGDCLTTIKQVEKTINWLSKAKEWMKSK